MRPVVVLALVAAFLLAAPVLLPMVQANHAGGRVVMPFGLTERYVPVVAGYEVVPRPLGCEAGTITPSTILFREDFEGPSARVTFAKDFVSSFPDDPRQYQNLWHVTRSIANEKGTNEGHSGTGKLYFGNSATGKTTYDGWRLAGTASFPAFTIPVEPTFMSWNDKFEVEGLFGYDHVWVELLDVESGRVYLLCSTDTDVRPDKSSHDGAMSTCSPYRTMLCPSGVRGDGGLHCPGHQLVGGPCLPYDPDFGSLGLDRVDPTAPHWESRYVKIPTELVGRTVIPRFSYDSADGVANGYLGWIGDDVMIATGLPNPEPYAYVPPAPGP